ncbi:hypothetical protein MRB53_033547 [Persea americana]|uniref:Uncharacterized protein n=1 Tax=Persea americana TaxID=3435 RepID=A0ACC2KUZ4_PERAE|nr:hypothetical protein MRB53_033547 [Persea americana]
MPPRAVRRPSTAPALKKKPPSKPTPKEEAEEKTKDKEQEQHSKPKTRTLLPSLNDVPRDPSPPPKDDHDAPAYHEIDRSERLDLDDHDLQSEPDYDAAYREKYERDEQEEGVEVVDEEDEEMEGRDGDEEEIVEEDGMEMEMEVEEEEEGDGDGEHYGDEEEHHDVVKERRKRKEFEVFVGGLDRDATEEDLRKVFREVGEVTEVRLMKNPATQKNKGFAFLRFATVEQARRAINELKHPVVNGKQCGVAPSQDSDTLFVGNICRTWTKEILKEKLARYGVDKFEDLTLVEDAKNEGMNRGFAFLDFSSRSDAMDACRRLQKRDVVFGTDRTAKVAFADTFIEPDDEIMAQVKTVFIDGLPASWDEDRVKERLRKYGKIEKIELARNMPAAKRTDFGFITFDTHDVAVACVEGINNTELGDSEKKVKVRARLSRPRQRGRSGKHARGGYSIGRSIGRGGRSSWSPAISRMDSSRYAGRSGRVVQSHSALGSGFRQPLAPRDRYLVADVVDDRIGSRRRLPPPERSLGRRSPVPAYGKVSSKRDYVGHSEPFPRSSDFASRTTIERRTTFRDDYPLRRSEYLDSPPQASRSATRRPPVYEEESYGRRMERPSYRDGQGRDYSSISGSKRPHSAVDDIHPRYVDTVGRQSRARYDYDGSSAALQYGESDYYGSEPTRLGRGSQLGYEGSSRSSAGHSQRVYDSRTSGMGYSRGGTSSSDAGGLYSSYGRDYIPSREDLGDGPYSLILLRFQDMVLE